ncbi:transcriptional regulator with XRE-family HTH domain [Nocardiopsis mwathae]|uniref:Transcriptional regulator with XRE-family HTH domain n=1 Tax=Nocardiopsis mwathae TaxID=1472723 RepID=A0A7W9YL63_9ACTN|nr:helix-turn-helix transcriptional regulator [Nocardiopsis mwathae]MBB6174193.1 transcriptional regulator with XRE-family HTH domain [Nocardiopsis mwathae]
MTSRYSPTIRRRRLSAELKRVRQSARMTGEEVAAAAELTKSTYSNIESGVKARPTVAEIRAILDACKLPKGQEYEEILNLCRQSRERGWWTRYRDVLAARYVGFEAEASTISTWEPVVIPGLLQTPEYIEATGRAALIQPADIKRICDSRMTRQRILDGADPPEISAIFDECALHRLDDYPEVRRAQVRHLLEMAERPNVTIQMTRANKLNPGSGGPFVILEFPVDVDPTVVYLETDTDGIYLEDPDEISRYHSLFAHLRLAALRPGETIALLQEIE